MTQAARAGERKASGLRAIVLGVEHPPGVVVVRSLARAKVPVVAIDHVARAKGLRSGCPTPFESAPIRRSSSTGSARKAAAC